VTSKPRLIGIRIDIETRSRVSIKTSGVYRYVECPDFKVLIIAYTPIRRYPGGATKLGRVRTLDLNDYEEVSQFRKMLVDPRFQKHAYNANFERIALSRWYGLPAGTYIDPENWHCSAIRCNVNGVYGTLDEVARALKAPIRKDPEGKRLIKLFSIPQRNGQFIEPDEAPQDFDKFGVYCIQDVKTEAVVAACVPDIPPLVQREYEMDQRINDRGVRHFAGLSRAAMDQVKIARDQTMAELKDLMGVENPNSVQQFRAWLVEQGYPMTSLDKDHRAEALDDPTISDIVAEALHKKGQASLSSVTKHKAMLNTRCFDGRIRGSLQFYGAHTGREAGRGFQPQNLPRYEAPAADRLALLHRTISPMDAPTAAKGTVRAAIVPARDHVLVTVDYNAIEARVLAGLCGEQWAEAEFRGAGKIYEATAATMFNVDKGQLVAALKSCGKCGKCAHCEVRAKGKVSNLALGYAGGAGALVTMGAEEAGIDCGNYRDLNAEWAALGRPGKFHEWERDRHDYPELIRLRDLYRDASPMTTRFWKLCAKAWDVAATTGNGARFGNNQVLAMIRDGRHNRLVLPSQRSIWYRFAASHRDPDRVDRDGNPRIDRRTFMGKGKGVGHIRIDTHGGKLTENVTQAVARDVLFDLLMRMEEEVRAGWPAKPVLHVHDEVVLEVHKKHAEQVLADSIGMMSEPPEWGKFLIVKGEGSIMERYGK
jgi:DNA polymerase